MACYNVGNFFYLKQTQMLSQSGGNAASVIALVAQWFTRLSQNQEVLGSRPEVDTGGALAV